MTSPNHVSVYSNPNGLGGEYLDFRPEYTGQEPRMTLDVAGDFEVRRVEAENCHMLFQAGSEQGRYATELVAAALQSRRKAGASWVNIARD